MINWWTALGYLGQLALLIARLIALGYRGKPTRTLIVIEDPANPLDVTTATAALAAYNATVLPGFTFTL